MDVAGLYAEAMSLAAPSELYLERSRVLPAAAKVGLGCTLEEVLHASARVGGFYSGHLSPVVERSASIVDLVRRQFPLHRVGRRRAEVESDLDRVGSDIAIGRLVPDPHDKAVHALRQRNRLVRGTILPAAAVCQVRGAVEIVLDAARIGCDCRGHLNR